MPPNDGWDWPLLLYVATVILRRTERQFWRMTPRKLNALTSAHAFVNNGGESDNSTNSPKGQEGPQVGFIDQVF
jgi:uncharacterized phage protein (TIGR02216 family)